VQPIVRRLRVLNVKTSRSAYPAVLVAALLISACGTSIDTASDPTTAPTSSSARSTSPTPTPSRPATTASSTPSTTAASSSPTATETSTSSPSPSLSPTPTPTPEPALLREGDSGPDVLALQRELSELGYWLGTPDGTYGGLTTQAVLALQGAADLSRDGVAGPQTLAALDEGVLPGVRADGDAAQIDRDAGTITFVRDGLAVLVLHTSTGTFDEYTHDGATFLADTPDGTFAVTWSYDGWREGDLGRLYRPRYFHPDGIAVHGYDSVPAYPASHGCARVSISAMDMIWSQDLMPSGSTVVVV